MLKPLKSLALALSLSLPIIFANTPPALSGEAHAQGDMERERARMVEQDLVGWGITDRRVLEVMGRVERHKFVEPRFSHLAYINYPLPIGEGQTISQPYVVALMTEAARIKPGEKVLEIGTGSGYQAAVLAELTPEVYTIEIRPALARRARQTLKAEGYETVRASLADGYFGWPEAAPFDAILITAAVDHLPPPLLEQLAEGGRLVAPLGSTRYFQSLTVVEKHGEQFRSRALGEVLFVPMIGQAEKGTPAGP